MWRYVADMGIMLRYVINGIGLTQGSRVGGGWSKQVVDAVDVVDVDAGGRAGGVGKGGS